MCFKCYLAVSLFIRQYVTQECLRLKEINWIQLGDLSKLGATLARSCDSHLFETW